MTSREYRRWPRRLAAIAVALLATLTVSTASAEVVDRIVAQVNDEIITLYELEQGAVPYLVQSGRSPQALQNENRRREILEEVLQDKIDTILVREEAREQGIEVAESQIDEWIQRTAQQQNMSRQQFRQAITRYGIEYEEYREIIRDNLLRMQLARQQGTTTGSVSEEEVDEAYREQFGNPDGTVEQLEVRHILLVPEEFEGGVEEARRRARELRQRIVEGEASFGELAEAHSQGPGAEDGGNIGTFGPGELAESFEEAIYEQEVGVVSEPVETEFGIHLIEVLDRTERQDPQVEQRRQQIRARLQQQQMDEQMESFLETLRTRAYIDVRY